MVRRTPVWVEEDSIEASLPALMVHIIGAASSFAEARRLTHLVKVNGEPIVIDSDRDGVPTVTLHVGDVIAVGKQRTFEIKRS